MSFYLLDLAGDLALHHLGNPSVEALSPSLGGRYGRMVDLRGDPKRNLPGICSVRSPTSSVFA